MRAHADGIIGALLENLGLVQRRQREAGSWIIDEEPLGEGDGWQDWPAFHRVAKTERGRIRFYVTAPGAGREETARVRQLAEHEYRIMARLAHDALLRPKDLVDDELGTGLVYPADDRFERLDLWLADQAGGQARGVPVADQLAIVRQVAEAVGYAHGNRVVHRGLSPYAVWVRRLDDDSLRVLVGDWQSAGAPQRRGSSPTGVTNLFGAADRLATVMRPHAMDAGRRMLDAFDAPEGRWSPDADRIRLDVFALGALTYYLFAGRTAASDPAAMKERLNRDGGLDLAADLPQVPSAVRSLVLEATRSSPSDRLGDVTAFLEKPAVAERSLGSGLDESIDPIDATPGTVIDGRFTLERRLGAGSTAVGLLVTDLSVNGGGSDAERVLKVALDDAAAARLTGEAEVLAGLDHPRLVRMIEGPIDLGGGRRRALLLRNAGVETLSDVLRGRNRLSLDLLERWGTDLLDALVALDRAGVDHRDIKPGNLGVRENPGDRVKHLVLFDFSLSRAATTAVSAGTPPYLDPFLDSAKRGRFDSAAERYSAAVVLFEMATGGIPIYREPMANPAAVPDEATVTADLFDPSIADTLVPFFTAALARDVRRRHDTAAQMLAAWRAVFAPVPKTVPDDAGERAEAAQPSTPLTAAGLSARALSALEPLGVNTVGDVVALDPVRLNYLSGVADLTRREVKERARDWRKRFAAAVTGRGSGGGADTDAAELPDPVTAAEQLLAACASTKAQSRRATVRLLLGLDPGVDAFVNQHELGAALRVTRGRAGQQLTALQAAWILAASSGRAVDAGAEPDPRRERIAAGLLRLGLDRGDALGRAEAGVAPLNSRRRNGRIAVLATAPTLLDAADALGQAADRLLADAHAAGEQIVQSRRAVPVLRDVLTRLTVDPEAAEQTADGPSTMVTDARLLRLAARLSTRAALSGADELHDRGLDAVVALALALKGVGGAQELPAHEVRDRVRARFPALPALPDRPRLDQLVAAAGLGLVYDEDKRAYRPPIRAADTTGLESRLATKYVPVEASLVPDGRTGHRLAESARARSFLALAVDARRADRAVEVLSRTHAATVIDVTAVLIEAMRSEATVVGLPWDAVQAADAAAAGAREAQGLAVLVQRALPAVNAAIEAATEVASVATPGGAAPRPVLLVEAGTLARYDKLAVLSRWTDLTSHRGQAVWLLVPQLIGNTGAVIDGRPLPLTAPGQLFRLDAAWLDAHAAVPTSGSAGPQPETGYGGAPKQHGPTLS